MKKLVKYILAFLILFITFNILLLIGSLFPSGLIEKNVRESSEILKNEGNYYQISKYFRTENDNYTDAIMINEAYSIDNTNPLYSYMAVRKNYEKGITQKSLLDTKGELISINNPNEYDPIGELSEFLLGNIDTSINYARYWHGYLPVLRILLIFFNIRQIRILLLIVFIFLFIYFVSLLKKKFGIIISIIFGIALICEGYFCVSYSLECAPVFLVLMISGIWLIKKIDKIRNFYFFMFIVACITNFVDYLTVPLITLAIPLYIFILCQQKEKTAYKECLKIVFKTSIIWFVGYAVTWLSKWVIYDVIYNEGLIKLAISQIMYRTKIYNTRANITIDGIIMKFIFENLIYIGLLCNFAIIIAMCVAPKYRLKLNKMTYYIQNTLPILIISLMPFVWYICLANHTVLHGIFVYRHMLIFLIGMMICLKNMFYIKKVKK